MVKVKVGKKTRASTDVADAAKILKECSHVMAFTGAGISTESGIPDFRSPGGLWEKYDPNVYADYSTFVNHPEYFWEMALGIFNTIIRARPNPGHKALVHLEKLGKLQVIVTQNIDRLHHQAGSKVPVLELHGAYEEFNCIKCGKQFSLYTDIAPRIGAGEKVLWCDACNGAIKPSAVMFGEDLPVETVRESERHAQLCDCVIIIGSSLQVFPANQIPVIAKERGAQLIIVNQEPTYLDQTADVVLQGRAGDILPCIVEALKNL